MEKINDKNIEREYIIPLRHRWKIVPRYKRANKAVKAVKEFLVRHMKIRDRDLDKIKVDKYLNEVIWSKGIKNPPARIKVRAIKDGEIVRVEAVEMPENMKFKKLREERIDNASKETAKKKKAEKTEEEKKPETEETTEKKEEEKEDKAATVEAGREMEKMAAKKIKHETKSFGKMNQPKHQFRKALEK